MPSAESPTIAVVMCTRNGERHIDAQLRSILDQTARPAQLVLRDDCSEDDTIARARALLDGAPFAVSIETNPNVVGPAANFETGIRDAEGDIVVLADQDDVWEQDRLAVIATVFANEPAMSAVFSDASLIDVEGRPLPGSLWDAVGFTGRARERVFAGKDLEQLCRWNVVTGATLAFRRSLVPTLVPFPERGMHDYWIALVAAATGTLGALDCQLVRYRLHDSNVVGVPPRELRRLVGTRRADVDVRNEELTTFSALRPRAAAAGAPATALTLLSDKEAHLRRRATLSGHLLRRLPVVTREVLGGRYHRLAHGWSSAAHDLVFGR